MKLPNKSNRDWAIDFQHENGMYLNRCMYCQRPFYGHKRRVVCRKCSDIIDSQITTELLR